MDNFTKEQKDEFACAYAIMALYDGGADITPDQIFTLLDATGNTKVEPYYPIIFSGFLKHPSLVAALIAQPTAAGGGRGGGGGEGGGDAAAEEKVEEKVEEEEMDMGGGMDMFGGDEAAGGGDY